MQFHLSVETDKYPIKDLALLKEIIAQVISISKIDQVLPELEKSINIVLMDDQQITEINETYLQHEGPTDVISFDYIDDYEPEFIEEDDEDAFVVGELYISIDTALRQAEEFSTIFQEELVLYIAHGMLHLIGYDDHCDEDIKEMRAAEKRVMTGLKEVIDRFDFIWQTA